MLSKLNYFTRKEERSVYKNRFVRSYEVKKEDLSGKRRDCDSFLNAKPSNLCNNLLLKLTILTEFCYLYFSLK